MRAICIIAITAFLCHNLNGQLRFGLKTDFTFHPTQTYQDELVNVKPIEVINLSYQKTNNSFGFGAYIYTENDLAFISADLLYKRLQSDYSLSSLTTNLTREQSNKDFSINKTYLSLPLSAGIKLKKFRIGGGPVLNYNLTQSDDMGQLDSITIQEQKISGGFQFLVGYSLGNNIQLELRREFRFNSVTENMKYRNIAIDSDVQPHNLQFSLGYLF